MTVNCSLPTYADGVLAYANYGSNASSSTNSLWIPLAEKAYAQWNETGNEGRDGQNAYASIEGGWMATVDAQVLGDNATDYNLADSTKQAMINALAAGQAVTIATDGSNNSGDTLPYGLYGSHAYAVIGYSASADTFTLHNPWGFDQPGGLKWSQLEGTCEGFVVANTMGSAPIGGVNLHALGAADQPLGGYCVEHAVGGPYMVPATVSAAESNSAARPVAAEVDAVLASEPATSVWSFGQLVPAPAPQVTRSFLHAMEV